VAERDVRFDGRRRSAGGADRAQIARIEPPSTGIIAPVTNEAAGDSRNAATRPNSSGSPYRRSGMSCDLRAARAGQVLANAAADGKLGSARRQNTVSHLGQGE
jgi:hypothetical protein